MALFCQIGAGSKHPLANPGKCCRGSTATVSRLVCYAKAKIGFWGEKRQGQAGLVRESACFCFADKVRLHARGWRGPAPASMPARRGILADSAGFVGGFVGNVLGLCRAFGGRLDASARAGQFQGAGIPRHLEVLIKPHRQGPPRRATRSPPAPWRQHHRRSCPAADPGRHRSPDTCDRSR